MLTLMVIFITTGGSYFEAPPPIPNIEEDFNLPVAVISTPVGIFSPHEEPAIDGVSDNAPAAHSLVTTDCHHGISITVNDRLLFERELRG